VKRWAAFFVTALCTTVSLSGQERQRTLPEIIADSGLQPGESSQGLAGPPSECYIECPSIAHTLGNTDVAIIAIVGPPRAGYLSDDQRDVYTDYPLEQRVVLYQREIVPPALGNPPAVTVLGGTANINGVKYTLTHAALPPLPVGATCLFLLKRVGTRYHLADGYYGVFRVSEEGLIPLVNDDRFATEYKGRPTATAMKDIVARLSAHRRETLPEAVMRTGRDIQQTYTTEYSPNLTLAEIATNSDLIARAIVVDGHPRLTRDETAIESDYTLQIVEQLWSSQVTRLGEVVILTAAGASESLTIEGHKVTGVDDDLPPFDVGAQYLLFLKFDSATGHYLLSHGGQSAFVIRGELGRESVVQMSSKFGRQLGFSTWNGPPPLFAFREDLNAVLEKERLIVRVPQGYSEHEGLKK
jgi:hypothetical protein